MFGHSFALGALLFCSMVLGCLATSTEKSQLQSRDGYGSYGGYGGYGHYGGNGGYYSMSSYGSGGLGGLGELLTGVLATLAGLALLAALAAALFLPLAFFIGRKKRDASEFSPEAQKKLKEMEILQQFVSSISDIESQPQRLMANYLSCSGLTNAKNQCLEKLTCIFQNPMGNFSSIETGAMSIIYDTIMANKFINSDFKEKLQKSTLQGKVKQDCKIYRCEDYFKGL